MLASHAKLAGRGEVQAGARPGLGQRWRAARTRILGTLDPPLEREFGVALDRSISGMLPALGAVFGIAVILFSAWDYWLDPERAGATCLVRLALVLAGAAGYAEWHPAIPVAWRCGFVYGTHTGAMILSSALLPGGLVLALPAITGAMFLAALVEPRLHRLLYLFPFPSLLFAVLAAAVLPQQLFTSSLLLYLLTLGLAVAIAVAHGRLRRGAFAAEHALEYAARHDSLSGLLARGYLIELATHDLALARRYNRPLTISMLDIDYFKRINDTFGHAAGDALIRAVGKACSAELRASDYFGRVGGEEFVCVMPETQVEDALACAERMREAVAAIRLALPQGSVACTISIGVAALGPGHAHFDALLAEADAALYRAKSGGRNRIELALDTNPGS
ncbi:GGDEF domain-containing protein [Massilia sp. AB1]|uniref:GGDEF domain-containing protein n=1 Tax=Massilia sp. AB1 TaxID=2823371 RepID=UPI001B839461|nr:GGDEF domain-containing protein [Massilia sp. AB1]MBQ5938931.1 GGDEF domain-containing protein [Massilia sp. AB1]